mmetsp:Transcript_17711/g.28784  ORF Transcript_17711/g.28784 Transcript_17711/m.28784 type:complete len:87 (-) Transcript_17711:261-521(-)
MVNEAPTAAGYVGGSIGGRKFDREGTGPGGRPNELEGAVEEHEFGSGPGGSAPTVNASMLCLSMAMLTPIACLCAKAVLELSEFPN